MVFGRRLMLKDFSRICAPLLTAKGQSGKVGYQDFFGTLFLDVKNNSVGTAFIWCFITVETRKGRETMLCSEIGSISTV